MGTRWLQQTRRHASRWLSIIWYQTRAPGIIVNYQMIHENKYISYLFLFYLILFYFETYVQGLAEETSLQILQLQKKETHFSWVKCHAQREFVYIASLAYDRQARRTSGSQNRAVLPRRHDKNLCLRLQEKGNTKVALASSNTLLENFGFHLKRKNKRYNMTFRGHLVAIIKWRLKSFSSDIYQLRC